MVASLYLASTSPYRAALLRRFGLPFAIEAPGTVEDSVAAEAPAACAVRLALAKAHAVAARHPHAWSLGSDQVADCGGRILGKPGNLDGCREQLHACSGRIAVFHTAAALVRASPAAVSFHVDRTLVRFRQLATDEIERYVERERPLDCAGGFRCEGAGIALFEAIESHDPTALIGLPLIWVAGALRQAGLDPLTAIQG